MVALRTTRHACS